MLGKVYQTPLFPVEDGNAVGENLKPLVVAELRIDFNKEVKPMRGRNHIDSAGAILDNSKASVDK